MLRRFLRSEPPILARFWLSSTPCEGKISAGFSVVPEGVSLKRAAHLTAAFESVNTALNRVDLFEPRPVRRPEEQPAKRGANYAQLKRVCKEGDTEIRSIALNAWPRSGRCAQPRYSTVTDFARFRGLSTSVPRARAV